MATEENPFEHVFYEFEMYLQASLIQCNHQFITNLLVDSRLVHMRNLDYFFCSKIDRKKGYMHYSMFLNEALPQEINHDLFIEIQKATSNSTCHLLKGRLKKTSKLETALLEQKVLPIFASLIESFILRLDKSICSDYASAWADERIKKIAESITDLIRNYKSTGM